MSTNPDLDVEKLAELAAKLKNQLIDKYAQDFGENSARALDAFVRTATMMKSLSALCYESNVPQQAHDRIGDHIAGYLDYMIGAYVTVLKVNSDQVENIAKHSNEIVERIDAVLRDALSDLTKTSQSAEFGEAGVKTETKH